MDITKALMEIGLSVPEKEFPSLEAVYKYLDDFVEKEKAKSQKANIGVQKKSLTLKL